VRKRRMLVLLELTPLTQQPPTWVKPSSRRWKRRRALSLSAPSRLTDANSTSRNSNITTIVTDAPGPHMAYGFLSITLASLRILPLLAERVRLVFDGALALVNY
jgi:hypothetical protein